MLFVESYLANRRGIKSSGIRFFNWEIPEWVRGSYKQIGVFAFGAACSQLTTDIAKYSIGRLRPHFYTVITLIRFPLSYLNNYNLSLLHSSAIRSCLAERHAPTLSIRVVTLRSSPAPTIRLSACSRKCDCHSPVGTRRSPRTL